MPEVSEDFKRDIDSLVNSMFITKNDDFVKYQHRLMGALTSSKLTEIESLTLLNKLHLLSISLACASVIGSGRGYDPEQVGDIFLGALRKQLKDYLDKQINP